MLEVTLEALKAYDIRPARVTPLPRSDNAAFRVVASDGGRFSLRVHRNTGTPWHPVRGIAEIASEIAWLAALRRDTPLVVPEPVPNRDGALPTVAHTPADSEPRICVLLHWVDGRFFDAGLTPSRLERVGAFMAHLHAHAKTFDFPEGFSRGRLGDLSPDVTAYVFDTLGVARGGDAVAIAAAVVERACAVQRLFGDDPAVFGLIHGDLHQENYLFHHRDVRAIDFDDCGFGLHHWDFAVTLSEISYKPGYQALRSALLRGYASVRPLPPDLERSVEPLMALRLLQVVMWFLEMRGHPQFSNWEEEVDGLLAELKEGAGG